MRNPTVRCTIVHTSSTPNVPDTAPLTCRVRETLHESAYTPPDVTRDTLRDHMLPNATYDGVRIWVHGLDEDADLTTAPDLTYGPAADGHTTLLECQNPAIDIDYYCTDDYGDPIPLGTGPGMARENHLTWIVPALLDLGEQIS